MEKKKVLVLKTAYDAVTDRLLEEIGNKENVSCFIQTSKLEEYKEKYPEIYFVDIQGERFGDLTKNILAETEKVFYQTIYIPHAGEKPLYFGNVILFASHINHKRIIFYNENGEKREVKKKGKIASSFYRIMIIYFKWLWRAGYDK
ncbi:MAG: hypothetical protein HDR17_13245 [Lachnospiraceae bacterium]|nr:hypothetical protein [Lachnospiraceae bacterium]